MDLKLTRTAINQTGTIMYLSDSTGDYHVDDNPGGWGAPNAERSARALLFQAFYNKSDGPIEATIGAYDPETVSDISVDTDLDGYYEVFVGAVPKVVPSIEGSYGWTITNGLVKFEDGVLRSATVKELFEDPLFTDSTSFKTVTLGQSAIAKNQSNLELIKLYRQHADDRDHNRDVSDAKYEYDVLRSLLEGAKYLWCMSNYTSAQSVIESLQDRISE